MWDGRETFKTPPQSTASSGQRHALRRLHFDLADQANSATVGHAKAAQPLTQEQRDAIVHFEMGLFTAQVFDSNALYLGAHGAHGGPQWLAAQPSYFGINDVVSGDYRTNASFDPAVFTLYDAWTGLAAGHGDDARVFEARQAVARGEALFNTKPIPIKGVKGLNDDLACPFCRHVHHLPRHAERRQPFDPAPLDIGLTDASRRTPDLPLYQLRNTTTGALVETTDPGRALITGKWKDIGRFKGPILRGLASRAPYFHNGFAADLNAVVDFYNQRFNIGFTEQERADLVAFLRVL